MSWNDHYCALLLILVWIFEAARGETTEMFVFENDVSSLEPQSIFGISTDDYQDSTEISDTSTTMMTTETTTTEPPVTTSVLESSTPDHSTSSTPSLETSSHTTNSAGTTEANECVCPSAEPDQDLSIVYWVAIGLGVPLILAIIGFIYTFVQMRKLQKRYTPSVISGRETNGNQVDDDVNAEATIRDNISYTSSEINHKDDFRFSVDSFDEPEYTNSVEALAMHQRKMIGAGGGGSQIRRAENEYVKEEQVTKPFGGGNVNLGYDLDQVKLEVIHENREENDTAEDNGFNEPLYANRMDMKRPNVVSIYPENESNY